MGRNWSNNLGMKKNASYKKKKKNTNKQTKRTDYIAKCIKGLTFCSSISFRYRVGERESERVTETGSVRLKGWVGWGRRRRRWRWESERRRGWVRVSVCWDREAFDWWGRVSGWVTERESVKFKNMLLEIDFHRLGFQVASTWVHVSPRQWHVTPTWKSSLW